MQDRLAQVNPWGCCSARAACHQPANARGECAPVPQLQTRRLGPRPTNAPGEITPALATATLIQDGSRAGPGACRSQGR